MKKVFIGLALLVLMFGCIDLGGDTGNGTQDTVPGDQVPVPDNGTQDTANGTPSTGNATQDTGNGTTTVDGMIISQQENQTMEQNYTPPAPPPPNVTEGIGYTKDELANFAVYFIYVGDYSNKNHGDAILIRKGDFDMLIDAGPAEAGTTVVSFLKSRGVDDIDVLVSTNADPWHYGGISAVSSNFDIEEFWWSGKTFGDAGYQSTVSGVQSKAKETRVVEQGYENTLNGMEFSVLNPKKTGYADVNNDAVVLRMQDRNFTMVFLSGVQFGAQSDMVNTIKGQLECDVMQAPYYGLGAGTSGIGNFLSTIKPETMVISGGPDESAESGGSRDPFRRLLDQYSIDYYENYAGGTVRVSSDGTDYAVGYFGS